MKKLNCMCALMFAVVMVTVIPVQADVFYGNNVTSIIRGTTPGDFPGQYYGGTYPGSYPVILSELDAKAAVLGAPDTKFLSLPGGGETNSYVEVSFPGTFFSSADLIVTEMADSNESARLFLWFADLSGNLQFNITTGASNDILVDLSSYSALIDGKGGIYKVGVMGLDQNGASKGFDLDAVGVRVVPEPLTLLLLGLGLVGIAGLRRKH